MVAPTNKNMHKQAERWPMSTSKVSKYNNHDDNIIITLSISKSSNPQQYTNHITRWLQRQAATHNWECRGDSNRYTPYRGKNLTYMSYDWLPEALTYDNLSQVPTKSKSGPCSRDEVLTLGLILPLKVKAPHEAGRCSLTK
jgi:hypothetical protein